MSGANPVQHEWMTLSVRPTSWWRHWWGLQHLPFFVGSRPRFSVIMTVPSVQAVTQSGEAHRHEGSASEWGRISWGIGGSHEHLFFFKHEETGVAGVTAISVGVRSGIIPTEQEGFPKGIREPYGEEQVNWQRLVEGRRYEVIARIPMLISSGEKTFMLAGQTGYVFETWTREGLFVKAILPVAGALLLAYLNLASHRDLWPF